MFLSWKIYILENISHFLGSGKENISHFLGSGKLHNMCNFRKCHMYFSIYKTCEISDTLERLNKCHIPRLRKNTRHMKFLTLSGKVK